MLQDGSAWSTSLASDDASNWFIRVITSDVTYAAAGTGYSMVLKQDGSVWSTGSNSFGQFGMGLLFEYSLDFYKVIDNGVKALAAGALHSLV